jgi:2-polyprenyl-3-methyl-5-hydroxy-6-metoxy-1,4-benzoquinol methylase
MLSRLDAERLTIRQPLRIVSELSDWLEDRYGIVYVDSMEHWNRLFTDSSLTEEEKHHFGEVYETRAEAVATGCCTQEMDTEFFDLIARDPLSGLVHTWKRSLILDGAAFLTTVLEATKNEGPILDVGCNVGYHASWIARRLRLPVVGIDTSREAIDYAIEKAEGNELCDFRHGDVTALTENEHFDCIYSSDALSRETGEFVEQVDALAQKLKTGGLLIFLDDEMESLLLNDEFAALADRHALGYCLTDITGGFSPEEVGWESKQCVVFLKGVRQQVPHDLVEQATSTWPVFASYANTPDIPCSEKTQAFFRAKAKTNPGS